MTDHSPYSLHLHVKGNGLDLTIDTAADSLTQFDWQRFLNDYLHTKTPCTMASSKPLHALVADYGALKTNRSTATIYGVTVSKVRAFDPTATLSSVTPNWLQAFEAHFLQTMSQNGIAIHLRNLRTTFNWAIANGLTDNYPFRQFRIREERVPIRNLTVEQIRSLRDLPLGRWQAMYRDLFLLSLFLCGVNAGDLLECRRLTHGRFVYIRKKTQKPYDLPVCQESMDIINRYKGDEFLLSPLDHYGKYQDFLHHWNDSLHKIGSAVNIQRLTTYCARYSFASIAADINIPRDTIALCLGHSWAHDVTSRYINYNRHRIDDCVRRVIDYVMYDKR